MNIIYLDTALHDMAWVRRYYREVLPAGRHRAREALRRCEHALRDAPFLGHPSAEVAGARELVISRTPFSFVYRIRGDNIEILRIADNRSDWRG